MESRAASGGKELATKGVGLFHFWPVGSQVVVSLLRFFSQRNK